MISEASGNVYWEISAFQHVVVVSSTRGKGGKAGGGYRYRLIETLTKYSINVSSSFRGRSFFGSSSTSFTFRDEYIEEGDGKLEPMLGAYADVARGLSGVDYQTSHTIAGDNPGAFSFRVYPSRRFASTTRAI